MKSIHLKLGLGLTILATPVHAQAGGGFDGAYAWSGPIEYDYLGYSVSNAGDVNADGFDDVIVGALVFPGSDIYRPGSALVYSGLDGTVLHHFTGESIGDGFGRAVSDAGDVNGDGFDDLLVGAPYAETSGQNSYGVAYLFSGSDGSLLYRWHSANGGYHLGWSVSSAGDVNQDGFSDVVIGAVLGNEGGPVQAGSAYLFSGVDGAQIYVWGGFETGDRFGESVSGAGDINGDGINDVIVGASAVKIGAKDYAGSAYLYSGSDGSLIQQLYQSEPWSADSLFGRSVSDAGDVDGDGVQDLIVGAVNASPYYLQKAGAAYVYSGATHHIIHQWYGEAWNDNFGQSVSGAGDINGDGFADLLVGAHNARGGGVSGGFGVVYAYSGESGLLIHKWNGQLPDMALGLAVSSAGDINGDGYSDVIMGSPSSSFGGQPLAGSAVVFTFNPYLSASRALVSASAGAQVDLELNFPDLAATYGYKILISVTGPGQMFKGVTIPLAEDFMVHETYFGNYPFANYTDLHGTLNINGDASASVNITANELHPRFIGRTFHIAAAASPDGFTPAEYSSVAIPIEITP